MAGEWRDYGQPGPWRRLANKDVQFADAAYLNALEAKAARYEAALKSLSNWLEVQEPEDGTWHCIACGCSADPADGPQHFNVCPAPAAREALEATGAG